MTPLLPQDHPSLVNVEALLTHYAGCIPPLDQLLAHLANADNWLMICDSIFFKPPPSVDAVHDVYLLVPLHSFDPTEPHPE